MPKIERKLWFGKDVYWVALGHEFWTLDAAERFLKQGVDNYAKRK